MQPQKMPPTPISPMVPSAAAAEYSPQPPPRDQPSANEQAPADEQPQLPLSEPPQASCLRPMSTRSSLSSGFDNIHGVTHFRDVSSSMLSHASSLSCGEPTTLFRHRHLFVVLKELSACGEWTETKRWNHGLEEDSATDDSGQCVPCHVRLARFPAMEDTTCIVPGLGCNVCCCVCFTGILCHMCGLATATTATFPPSSCPA